MLYDSPIMYSQPHVYYVGSVVVRAPSLSSPIILNNITLLVFAAEDYTNQTTIAVMSINYTSSGIVEIEVLDENVQAFFDSSRINALEGTTISVSV